jgi:FixJ family two-component response regulator
LLFQREINESRPTMAHSGAHIILVLDDDPAVRNSLKFTLEVEGFLVREFSSASELLSHGSLPASSCLVVDYHMPEMNGLELVSRLRDRRVQIPAILIASQPNDNLRKRAAEAAIPIVEKPFIGSRLLDCIRNAFDGSGRPS